MLSGTRCAWLQPGSEIRVETRDCLACASSGKNPCGYPLPMLRLMTRDRDPKVVNCSATMLGGCPREQGIKKHVGWYIHPDKAYTRAFGSVVHIGLEKLHNPGTEAVIETRYSREILLKEKKVSVTAQLDALYFEDDTHVLIKDYKVVSTLAPSKLKRKAENYIPQLSIQRWILDHHGIIVTDATLTFIAHDGRRDISLLFEEDFPHLLSLDETQAYLERRLPALVASLEGNLPPPLDNPADFWRCRYCDVSQECQDRWNVPLPYKGL